MSTTLPTNPAVLPPSAEPSRKRFTRREYHFLSDNGLFAEGRRYELIDGDILESMGQKEPHGSVIMLWMAALIAVFGVRFLRCQMPIVLDDDAEPEPDLAVTSQPVSAYINGDAPPAAEVRLLIEVAVSSLSFDTGRKARRYAASGIPEYWVSDVEGRRLIVHHNPTPTGYASVVPYGEEASVSPLAAPTATFRVGEFLP